MAAQLVDTAKFPAQYQYTVTGRMRKRGTHGQLGTLVSINGKNVTLFRHRHLLYAVADRCSHQGAPPHPTAFSTPHTPPSARVLTLRGRRASPVQPRELPGGSLCLVRRCRAPIPRFPHAHWVRMHCLTPAPL